MKPPSARVPTTPETVDPALAELLDRLTQRLQAGQSVDLQACLREHPQFAQQLPALLPALQALAGVADSVDGRFAALAAGPAAPGNVTLGDYQLLREVGRGGMGAGYEAVQLSLGRAVALKVLPGQFGLDPTYLERFRREAKAAGRLHHPHIVTVYGVGEHHGVHFYAMQFIRGQGLDACIRQRRRLLTYPMGAAPEPRTTADTPMPPPSSPTDPDSAGAAA